MGQQYWDDKIKLLQQALLYHEYYESANANEHEVVHKETDMVSSVRVLANTEMACLEEKESLNLSKSKKQQKERSVEIPER